MNTPRHYQYYYGWFIPRISNSRVFFFASSHRGAKQKKKKKPISRCSFFFFCSAEITSLRNDLRRKHVCGCVSGGAERSKRASSAIWDSGLTQGLPPKLVYPGFITISDERRNFDASELLLEFLNNFSGATVYIDDTSFFFCFASLLWLCEGWINGFSIHWQMEF